jgi:hypothetical protein
MFGNLMLETFTGVPPFPDVFDHNELRTLILSPDLAAPRLRNEFCGDEEAALMAHCLTRDRHLRPEMAVVCERLREMHSVARKVAEQQQDREQKDAEEGALRAQELVKITPRQAFARYEWNKYCKTSVVSNFSWRSLTSVFKPLTGEAARAWVGKFCHIPDADVDAKEAIIDVIIVDIRDMLVIIESAGVKH